MRRLAAPEGSDAGSALSSAIVDLGAQLIEAEPPGEFGRLAPRAQSSRKTGAVGVGRADDDQVEQDLALRRQQRRVARFAGREPLDVVGHRPCRKLAASAPPTRTTPRSSRQAAFLVMACVSGRACKDGTCQIGRFRATRKKGRGHAAELSTCVLVNGTVVNHDGAGCATSAFAAGASPRSATSGRASAGERIDCRGLHILPGVIDSQVHFREPGLEHKEDLETGSRAAVLGGVTAVFEMPNTDPPTTSADALEDKLARAKGRMHCDFAFWVGGTHENVADIPELERLPGAAGIKVFMGSSTGSLLVADDEGVLAILQQTRRRAAFHSEDEARLIERKGLRIAGDPASHPVWRDEIAALRSTERLIRLAREARAQVHVLHISTARGDRVSGERQGRRELRGDAASPDAAAPRTTRGSGRRCR